MSDRMARLIILLLAVAFAVSPFLSSGFGGFTLRASLYKWIAGLHSRSDGHFPSGA